MEMQTFQEILEFCDDFVLIDEFANHRIHESESALFVCAVKNSSISSCFGQPEVSGICAISLES
jgi:hypothetical protein